MIDGIRYTPKQNPIKPEVDTYDDGNPAYNCPECGEPLSYKQSECDWCHQKIDWSKDGEQK